MSEVVCNKSLPIVEGFDNIRIRECLSLLLKMGVSFKSLNKLEGSESEEVRDKALMVDMLDNFKMTAKVVSCLKILNQELLYKEVYARTLDISEILEMASMSEGFVFKWDKVDDSEIVMGLINKGYLEIVSDQDHQSVMLVTEEGKEYTKLLRRRFQQFRK